MAFLVSDDGRQEPIDASPYPIGRGASNRLVLEGAEGVSRRHAVLRREADGWTIEDLDSTNGTWVNGRRLTRRRRLRSGDRVAIGGLELCFVDDGAGLAEEAEPEARPSVRLERLTAQLASDGPLDPGTLSELDLIGTMVRDLDVQQGEMSSEARRLRTLYQVSEALNVPMDPRALLERVLELGMDLLGADQGLVARREGEAIVPAASRGLPPAAIEELSLSQGLLRQVLDTGEPVLTADAAHDPKLSIYASLGACGIRSVICVPMKDRDQRVRGLLYVDSRSSAGLFTREDVDTLQAVAHQAGVALSNHELAEQARRAETLAAVGRVATRILHDLRNPVHTAGGFADLLLREATEPEQREHAVAIKRQVGRIDALVQDILTVAQGRRPRLSLDGVAPGEVVREALEWVELDLRSAAIDTEVDDRFDGRAWLDRERLTRVFVNLATNAREAMAGRPGRLRIAIEPLGPEQVRVSWSDDAGGVPESIADDVFEPFTTARKARGIGIGLAVVRSVVEAHGGRVVLDNRPGDGATFRIDLLTTDAPPPDAAFEG